MNAVRVLVCVVMCLLADRLCGMEPHTQWFDPAGNPGKLVIAGGGRLPDRIVQRFIELAGGEQAKIVVVPTASESPDTRDADQLLRDWKKYPVVSLQVFHARSHEHANDQDFLQPLREATGVWFAGGQQSRIAEAYVGTGVERELDSLLARGGVIGGTSAGAAVQSRLMIARGHPRAELGVGFDLLPGSVIDQHFRQRDRRVRLVQVLADHPAHVGFGIDEGTALLVDGRQLQVLGDQCVTICLAAGANRPAEEAELVEGDVVDLTALRRAARDRVSAVFPAEAPATPHVPHGALILGGGGGMTDEVIAKFLELAGGPDALIVVLPTANPDPLPDRSSEERLFRRAGATNVTILRQRSRADVESAEFIETLHQARGVWFGGGRQWRFIDAYENTRASELLHDVLRRGGVIGGSSAGASIQAEYLARGNPLGNTDIMAAGYERGLGFLPGTAVDQHFAQRQRFADMTSLVDKYPQLLGIGIDEATAIVVQQSVATVLGEHQTHFFDREIASESAATNYVSVAAGGRYDLVARRVISADSP